MKNPAMAKEIKAPVKKLVRMSDEEYAKFCAESDARMAKDRELLKLSLASAARNGDPLFSSR
jgi:hypothetical protein